MIFNTCSMKMKCSKMNVIIMYLHNNIDCLRHKLACGDNYEVRWTDRWCQVLKLLVRVRFDSFTCSFRLATDQLKQDWMAFVLAWWWVWLWAWWAWWEWGWDHRQCFLRKSSTTLGGQYWTASTSWRGHSTSSWRTNTSSYSMAAGRG